MADFSTLRTVSWEEGVVRMIDQTSLPTRFRYVVCESPQEVAQAIMSMVVRGAPALGVAAAMGVALAASKSKARSKDQLLREVRGAGQMLRSTRPTAVNLFWAIDRILRKIENAKTVEEGRMVAVAESKAMAEEDVETNRRLGKIGATLIESGDTVLTQCNAGALATVGYGTALGVIRAAREQGKYVSVLVPETRPALQGSRLTAYELAFDDIDCRIIPDTAVGYMMSHDRVDKVVVGADRITRDGFVFNKIGTYQEAVMARRHRLPFYPAAPYSSFDMKHSHEEVVIEERSFDEVVKIRGRRIAPKGVPVSNPAFDATPPQLVTAIISDRGLIRQPVLSNLFKTIIPVSA